MRPSHGMFPPPGVYPLQPGDAGTPAATLATPAYVNSETPSSFELLALAVADRDFWGDVTGDLPKVIRDTIQRAYDTWAEDRGIWRVYTDALPAATLRIVTHALMAMACDQLELREASAEVDPVADAGAYLDWRRDQDAQR